MKKVTKEFLTFLENPRWFESAYDGRKKEFRHISKEEWDKARQKAIYRRYVRTTADDYATSMLRQAYHTVVEWAKPEHQNYQKVAMYGHTWLYLCSPVYGHADYNKHRLVPIKGHERQCEFLVRVSQRVANSK